MPKCIPRRDPAGREIVVAANTDFSFRLARFMADGSPDTTFHEDGIGFPYGMFGPGGYAVAIQKDGRIVSAGSTDDGGLPSPIRDVSVVRLMSDGEPDTDFGVDSAAITSVGSGDNRAYAVAVQSDDKIVVAGFAYNGIDNDFALLRYTPDGQLDVTFDTDGIITPGVGSSDDVGYAIAIQKDGKIVVAGGAKDGGYNDFAVVRYWP